MLNTGSRQVAAPSSRRQASSSTSGEACPSTSRSDNSMSGSWSSSRPNVSNLTDIIKMVAYQAESDLVALLRPHYARADQEGRTLLLHELFPRATCASPIVSCASPWRRLARRRVRIQPRRSPRSSTNGDNFPRLAPPNPFHNASTAAYRACLSQLPGPVRRIHGRGPSFLICAET